MKILTGDCALSAPIFTWRFEFMSDTNSYYTKRPSDPGASVRKRKSNRPLTFFLVIVVIILAMSVFFKISVINVEGNSIYSDKEIIEASGIQIGDNLFFINRISAGSRVVVKLPYVDSVSISRGLPNECTIVVEESRAVASVNVDGTLWSVSQSGKFLGTVDADDPSQLAEIEGITVDKAAVGDNISVPDGEKDRLEYLLQILEQIKGRGLETDVTAIDVSDPQNPQIEYQNRFTVKFGAQDDTEYKFAKLLSAIGKLSSDDSGTLDLSDSNKVVFNPN